MQLPIQCNPHLMQSNQYPLNPNNPIIQSNANLECNATHTMQSNPIFYPAGIEISQSNAIIQSNANVNCNATHPMQSNTTFISIESISNTIHSISTHTKHCNHSKQRKCGTQRNIPNAIQSNFLPSGN